MQPFDLVVLDLDGTVINPYRREAISPAVLDAIARVQALGIAVTIGTGRTFDYIRHHLPSGFQLTHPVLTTQGAVIGDPISGQVLEEQDIPLPEARRLAHWIDEIGLPTGLYINDAQGRTTIYMNQEGRDPEEADLFLHIFGEPMTPCPHFADLLAANDAHPPIKAMTLNDPGLQSDVMPEYLRRFSPALSVTRTHPWLVEATAAGVDKGSGLRRLCELLGVDPRRVMAVGDSDNDIPMLQAAGFAVAMGNASPGVKAVAHWEAPSIDQDGAAAALRKWVLEEKDQG